jgi:hypothetical protein
VQPVVVTINPKPTVVTVAPAAVCSPNTIDLTTSAVTTGSTASLVYTYFTNAAATTALGTPSAIATSGTYYIKGTTSLGCSDVQPVVVTINPKPTVVTVAPAAVCSPNTIDLTTSAVTTGSTASLSYSYFTDATATVVLGTASAVAASGTYFIKGTDGNSCSSVSSVVVKINALPSVTFVASKTKVCLGESLILTGSGAVTYAWNNGVSNGVSFTPTTTQTYNLSGTDANGCINTGVITIPVNPLPIITPISAAANSLMVGANMILNGTATNGSPNYNYTWTSSNPTIAIINGSSSSPTLIGVKEGLVGINYYAVDANGCRSLTSSLFNVDVIPGVMEFEIPNAFVPTGVYAENKFLRASYSTSVKRVNYFRIFNRMGKMVYEVQNVDPFEIKWDGKFQNVLQESDGYMWIAEIAGLGSVSFQRKSGQFLLIK